LIDNIIAQDLVRTEPDVPNIFEDRSVLVTGGAGFIGSWICDLLHRKHANVTVVDNLATGRLLYIDHLVNLPGFDLQCTEVETLELGSVKFDYVLHLASRPAPDDFQRHPVETALANSVGSYRLLEIARKCDAVALFASSSEVYGQTDEVPTPETCLGSVNILGMRGCYDESKRLGEALFIGYHREYGLDVKIARIFNTYGPRLRSDATYARALSRFIAQSLAGEDVTVLGDGTQTRSFCYVTDTVLAMLKMLALDAKDVALNIGNPDETRIIDLAREIMRLTGSKSKISWHALPPDDPKRRCPDISKAGSLLAWKPEVRLEDGLERTILWFKTNRTAKA
jgi:UDP-glucuronate decarboxylase